MNEISNEVLTTIVELLAAVVAGLVCEGIRQGVLWLKTKVGSTRLKAAADEFERVCSDGINYTEQKLVKQFKAAKKWNAESQKAVLQECTDYVYASLSQTTLNLLTDNPDELVQLIEKKIESELGKLHKQ